MGKSRLKLKKSTIITMVSCGSFIVMTFLALLFFVKFPITPSEKIISSIGRESIYKNNNLDSMAVTQTSSGTQTTVSATSQTTATQTTTASATHSDFVITITTGKGFFTTGGHMSAMSDVSEKNDDYSDFIAEETTDIYNYDEQVYTETDDNESYDYNYDYYNENY